MSETTPQPPYQQGQSGQPFQPGPAPQPGQPFQPMPPQPAPARPNFFTSLFDFQFNGLVAPSLISIAYGIAVALIAVQWLFSFAWLIVGFGVGGFFIALLVGAAVSLFQLCIARIIAEAAAVYFRTSEDVRAIRERR